MRGEKSSVPSWDMVERGSPPLARGKAEEKKKLCRGYRITPSCAGKRNDIDSRDGSLKDHPRLRGEKAAIRQETKRFIGSPPLARGKDKRLECLRCPEGITPACAGKR